VSFDIDLEEIIIIELCDCMITSRLSRQLVFRFLLHLRPEQKLCYDAYADRNCPWEGGTAQAKKRVSNA